MRYKIDLIDIVKIAVVPGALVGIISLPINYYLLLRYREEISLALGRPYYPSLGGLLIITATTIVFLVFCGALYALFYHKLPGGRAFTKASVVGFVVYAISRIGDFIIDYPISRGLFIDSALLGIPLLLVLYPYLLSKLYSEKLEV